MASASLPWFPIRTARLLLREFQAGDLDDIHAYASDQDTVRYMEWGPNTPKVSSERLLLTLAEQEQWPRRDVNLAAQLLENGRVIGSVRLGLRPRKFVVGRRLWLRGGVSRSSSRI